MVAKVWIDAGRGFDVDVIERDAKTGAEVSRTRIARDTRGSVDLHVNVAFELREVTAQDLVREMKAKAAAGKA